MFEVLAGGLPIMEGPRYRPRDGALLFGAFHAGGVHALSPSGHTSVVVEGRTAVGGILLHADGGLVLSGSDVAHVAPDGTQRQLFRRGGMPCNDLGVDRHGHVLVGTLAWCHDERGRMVPFGGGAQPYPGELWRIGPAGRREVLRADVGAANGIATSPDGSRVYIVDSRARAVLVLEDVAGVLTRRSRIEVPGGRGFPDGLAADEDGCLWIAWRTREGVVLRVRPDGRLDRRIEVPARLVTSLCFGGSDRRDLYLVARAAAEVPADEAGVVLTARVDVPGLELAPAVV